MMQTYVLFLILILVVRQTRSFNFEVVSTTERLSPKNENQNDSQQCCSGLKEMNYRLLILEMQNAQLQKRVDKLDQNEQLPNKKRNDGHIVLQEIEKRLQESINQIDDRLKNLNDLANMNKNNSEGNILLQEIQEIKKKQQLLQMSTEEVKKQLEELIKQHSDKSKKLNESDVTVQQLEENQISQASNVKTMNNFKNCKELHKNGNHVSGVYVINLPTIRNFTVFCDMLTDGGGWIQVLTRIDESQNFELNWTDYKTGFGDPSRNFWIGLEPLYQLTNSEDSELFVELVDWDNKTFYARYNKFKIGSEEEGYPLNVIEGYSGDAGDGLSPLIRMKFSTKDKDQDDAGTFNCANYYRGGWWYKSCYLGTSKLTGIYSKNTSKIYQRNGIHWMPMHKGTLQKAKMMIRSLN